MYENITEVLTVWNVLLLLIKFTQNQILKKKSLLILK